jgi:AAA-like domain
LHEGEPVAYRTLAQIFWPSEAVPDGLDGASFPGTRQAVHYLRLALGTHSHRLKSAGRGLVMLDLRDAEVDVAEFDRICRQNSSEDFSRAVALHTAPLLESWNDPWVAEQRTIRQRSLRRITALLQDEPAHPNATALAQPSGAFTDEQTIGGAMLLGSRLYIERNTDHKLMAAIASRPSTVLVKADAWMGKSSLLARGMHEARTNGFAVALTDFQTFSHAQFENSSSLFMAIAASLALQLNLDFDPQVHWRTHLGPGTNLEQFVRRQALSSFDTPLVWCMDGIDQLFMHDCSGELFVLLRSWHNRRAMDPAGPWTPPGHGPRRAMASPYAGARLRNRGRALYYRSEPISL